MLDHELASEFSSAASFLVQENDEPEFNQVGTVLATECRLLAVDHEIVASVEESVSREKGDRE